ncbi:bifunctional adenosylcobinamide kinase/adenosylcobinamide-phosphate guanylyltransferase [Ferrimonas lipolytica]|uniref:Bifunctional adenosylcobalamin biosynthesis protein n=1 Tax=Ferrimonas lipolytica TaxID=2724191 RepID=A0A6H1UDH8_9GAMM|nr:bifunctional adenosylcobinamide kinase/adenosylcobinamide-phosphate guanylyltransferase [Ferrimonas lipolytica]QIZ76266.1 bifunctional adenosylcobinamide kinase/adenosylcobinamide-phosphate guanylyltransferase [Ferrimonas lipolytica]
MSQQLILGGARSGKSRLAQTRAQQWQTQTGGEVMVIATAENHSGEGSMAARIAHHQANRPAHWLTVETSRDLAAALLENSRVDRLIVVDCLTLWLANEMFADNSSWPHPKQALLEALAQLNGPVIFIGNELGQAVVPLGQDNRNFVDECGWLHQALAQRVNQVTLTVAGLPVELKR